MKATPGTTTANKTQAAQVMKIHVCFGCAEVRSARLLIFFDAASILQHGYLKYHGIHGA